MRSLACAKFTLLSLALFTGIFSAPHADAQASNAPPKLLVVPDSIASHPDWPVAKPADVESLDALVASLYSVISGPAGPRDWDRFRSLFLPEAQLGVVRPARPALNGEPAKPEDFAYMTPDFYARRNGPFFNMQGFFEHGIANRTQQFGNLVTVWSTYESRHAASDAQAFARGINALTIIKARGRFWIASIFWDAERPGLTIPEKYLQDSK